jgi:hypothetical protein
MVYHCGIQSEKVHAEPPLGDDALSLDEPHHVELGDDDPQLVREDAVQAHGAVQVHDAVPVHDAVQLKDEVPVQLVYGAVSQSLCAELAQPDENQYCLAYLPPPTEADVDVAPSDDEKVLVHDSHDYVAHYHHLALCYYVVGSH